MRRKPETTGGRLAASPRSLANAQPRTDRLTALRRREKGSPRKKREDEGVSPQENRPTQGLKRD